MNPFEKPKAPQELQKEATQSLEKYAKKKLEEMSPEEKKKFFEGRKEVKRKNL